MKSHLLEKKYDQMVFYNKNDAYVDRTDYLHNIDVVKSELEKFKQVAKLTKPIEIKLLYNSTSESYRNGVEIVQQQLNELIGKDIFKITIVGKEQNSFLEDFKKGSFDMAFVDDFINSKINTSGGPTTTIPFTFLKSFVYQSEDYLVNTTGKWNFWDNLFSKDPYTKSNTDQGSGWASKLVGSLNLEIKDGIKLTEDVFITKDDIELLKWYFAKNNTNSSWTTKTMDFQLYNELIANADLKLNEQVFKKYFFDFNDPKNKDVKLTKFDDKLSVDNRLPFQFRAVRILEALIRYYQPVLNISTSTAGFLAQKLIGYVTSPFQYYKFAYDCGMELKNFDFKLPNCEAYRKTIMKYLILLLNLLIIALIVATLIFFIMNSVPGRKEEILSSYPSNPELAKKIIAELGLDQPIFIRYKNYIGKLILHGDLETSSSLFPSQKISSFIFKKFSISFEVGIVAVILALAIGIYVVKRPGGINDTVATILVSV